MRFLAVYSTNSFWSLFENSEKSSNNSDEKLKNFFSYTIPQTIKKHQKVRWDALSNTWQGSHQNEWHNTFFIFYKGFE